MHSGKRKMGTFSLSLSLSLFYEPDLPAVIIFIPPSRHVDSNI